mmetsp:Transcript_122791/g.348007  ORF Transcript_122791/g.348007 Transcript_122791/m.348007 type:complete len:250 (-) Transcript_122791:1313-2062(-)
METPRSRTPARRAEETCASTEASMQSNAPCAPSTMILARFAMPSTFSLDLAMLCFASTQGPLGTLVSLTSWFFRNSWTSATDAESLSAAAFTARCTVMGASTAASSDSLAEANCFPASSSSFSAACALSTLSDTAPRTRDAAFLSFLSSCFLRSRTSRFAWSRLPSSILVFSWSSLACIWLTLGRSFASSALASARGPWVHCRSWAVPWLSWSRVSFAVDCAALTSASRSFMKAAYWVCVLRYVVPWLP